jgi:hypothetical protein
LPIKEKPVIIMDAGIATENNLKLIKSKEYDFDYICVSRKKIKEENVKDNLVEIKSSKKNKIETKYIKVNGETFLYCHSFGREKKEISIKNRYQLKFEEGLKSIENSINKPRGQKKSEKIMERICRLKERYFKISKYYEVNLEKENDIAKKIIWTIKDQETLDKAFAGTYYIRTSIDDFSEQELWSLYMNILHVEDSFKILKSNLGLRPNFHQLDNRMEGHIFITILSYHLLNYIQKKLLQKGIKYSWETIRLRMSSQTRKTISFNNEKSEQIYIKNTSEPEIFHDKIYSALNLPSKPLARKKISL